jgi:hypothetical protein
MLTGEEGENWACVVWGQVCVKCCSHGLNIKNKENMSTLEISVRHRKLPFGPNNVRSKSEFLSNLDLP